MKQSEPHAALAQTKPQRTAFWIFAHPDDEVLNAAAEILRHKKDGFKNIIVTVTSGDKVPEGYQFGLTQGGIMETREKEETAALSVIGIPSSDILFLRKLDQDITVPIVEQEIEKLIKAHDGELYFRGHSPFDRYSPVGDAHPDHTIIGKALLDEWKKGVIKNLLLFRMGQLYDNIAIGQCRQLTAEESEMKKKIKDEYTLYDPANGRYGLGGKNAQGPFEKSITQPECFELPQ